MTRSASEAAAPVTLSPTLRRIGPALLLARRRRPASSRRALPGAAARPARAPAAVTPDAPTRPLEPAQPGRDPFSLFAWLFTPIFQVMFIILIAVYQFLENLGVPGAIAWRSSC